MSKKTTYGPVMKVSENETEQKIHRYGKKAIMTRRNYKQTTREGRAGSVKMFQAMAAAPSGREKVKNIYEDAKKWIREKNLPESYADLVILQFGEFDDEYLMREIIRYSEIILQEDVTVDDAVDAALQFALCLKDFNELQEMIHDAGNSRKSKSLKNDIDKAFDEIGGDATREEIYYWLRKEEVLGRAQDGRIIVNNGKNIKRRSFDVMVSKVRKKRKTDAKNKG